MCSGLVKLVSVRGGYQRVRELGTCISVSLEEFLLGAVTVADINLRSIMCNRLQRCALLVGRNARNDQLRTCSRNNCNVHVRLGLAILLNDHLTADLVLHESSEDEHVLAVGGSFRSVKVLDVLRDPVGCHLPPSACLLDHILLLVLNLLESHETLRIASSLSLLRASVSIVRIRYQ